MVEKFFFSLSHQFVRECRCTDSEVQLGVSREKLKIAFQQLAAQLPLMKSDEKRNQALASFYQDLGFKVNAEADRLRFDLTQDMSWSDFERTMKQLHLVLRDVASFVPFTNPNSSEE